MRTKIFAALAAATAFAAPAMAQNANPFTGPRIEALTGYDSIKPRGGSSSDGVLFGVGLGYDFQAGGAVIGLEGEAMGSSARSTENNLLVTGDQFRDRAGRDLYIGGRVGFAASPSTLIYGKAGYTNFRAISTYNDGAGNFARVRSDLDGYRLGVGLEQRFALFGPSGYFKAEYRYSHYKNANFAGESFDVNLNRHQGVVGVGVRF